MASEWDVVDSAPADEWAVVEQPQRDLRANLRAKFAAGDAARNGQAIDQAASLGIMRGAMDIPDAGAQLLTRGLVAASPAGSGMETWAKGQQANVDSVNTSREQAYRQQLQAMPDQTLAPVGRIAGNVAASLPLANAVPSSSGGLLARLLSGGAGGAVTGAMQPVDTTATPDYWDEKRKQVQSGAIGGTAGAGLAWGLGKMLDKPRPEIQTLMDEGIRPTPGQIAGGWVGRIEDKLQSIPGVGDAITGARRAAVRGLNRAAIDRVLAPLGEKLDDATPLGREAIDEMQKKVSAAYQSVLPKVSIPGSDPQFTQDIAAIGQTTMIPTVREKFEKIARESIMPRLSNGPLDGETFKIIESKLGTLATSMRTSPDVEARELGGLLTDLQGSFRSLLERSNPAQAKELQAANLAFSMSVRVNDAASRVGTEQGVFTPAQLLASVLRQDKSARHNAFARGDALMQDLAEPARAVLGASYPDSGTAGRAALAAILGSALAGGAMFNKGALAPMALSGAMSIPYLPGVRNATAHLLATRGPGTEAVRQGLNTVAAPVGGYIAQRYRDALTGP